MDKERLDLNNSFDSDSTSNVGNLLQQPWVAYDPHLIPPLHMMQEEGVHVLEEWLRWAEEWSMLLRIYGGITSTSAVMEIGCGLGRIAFPLRHILSSQGSYDGFDIYLNKITFLEETFQQSYPNFRFIWAGIHHPLYNPEGSVPITDYFFPYQGNSFDIVYATSIFTRLLPDATEHLFCQSAQALKQGGRCLFSFFLLDHYQPGIPRPAGFERDDFNFDHSYGDYGDHFAIVDPDNPERMTAYRLPLIEALAAKAGLALVQASVPGLWSGSISAWVSAHDLIILEKAT